MWIGGGASFYGWSASSTFPSTPMMVSRTAGNCFRVFVICERMAATLEWLAKHDDCRTYSHALRCQVWLIANRKSCLSIYFIRYFLSFNKKSVGEYFAGSESAIKRIMGIGTKRS